MSTDHYGRTAFDNETSADDDQELLHHRHTEFLDLTNGEGGDRKMYFEDTEDEDEFHDIVVPPPTISGAARRNQILNKSSASSAKVVETGQEHTGRWTREEHAAFLSALHQYGKEWKKVAAKVKTRTVVQTRTHAQKYFQKMLKTAGGDVMEDGQRITSGDSLDTMAEAKKSSAQKRQRKAARVPTAMHLSSSAASTTSAVAHILSDLPAKSNSGFAVYPTHGFATAATTLADLPPPPAYPAPSPALPQQPLQQATQPQKSTSYFVDSVSSWGRTSLTSTAPMKIVAPDPGTAQRRGFPEPSPAACGTRKLAELAAAQMLAGVAASGAKPQRMGWESSLDQHQLPRSDQNSLDGDVTPPPSQSQESKYTPPPRLGLSLQIVNPETLGVTFNETRRRIREGEPTTPWDGQLEQLVTEERMKEQPDDKRRVGFPLMPSDPCANHFPHPVCGPGNSLGRSSLHKAVCEMDLEVIQRELLDAIGVCSLQSKDEAGYMPIHSASALSMLNPGNSSLACKITLMLLVAGADASAFDGRRNTPLHWAARSGDAALANILLLRNCPPDAHNDDGDTALHWALRAGLRGMKVARELIENGCRASIPNNSFRRAVDACADGFPDEKDSLRLGDSDMKKPSMNKNKAKADSLKAQDDLAEERRQARLNLLSLSCQSRTLVLHHPECLEHIPKAASDWECPDRVTSIMRRVLPDESTTETTGIFPYEVSVSSEFDRAKLDFLSRVHSSDYLSFVNDLSKELTKRKEDDRHNETGQGGSVVPFTPMVQKTVMKDFGGTIKKDSHSDTSFSAGSLRAARRAAGAVQHAVDCVLVGRHRNAFCVVRPPGHHAGVKGLLAGAESCGFCIFNNVAAGALHAISDERLMCQRCAIVDIDVHHGNGTEEIVKRCQDPGKLFFFSIHLYDSDKRKNGFSFYPGTGDEDDIAHNIINVPIAPLWREQMQSPQSTATTVSSHNTRHKAKRKADEMGGNGESVKDDSSEAGALSTTDNPDTIDTESESASIKGSCVSTTKSPRQANSNMGRLAYRRAIQNRLLPSLRAFNPDLILISAGFDAAKGDVGNARHNAGGKERMGLDLEPEDYAWTTRKILEIADICCQGRVVSVLEGGYGRSPVIGPATTDSGASNRLDKAFFSECAIRHLHAMIDPYDTELRFGRDRAPNP